MPSIASRAEESVSQPQRPAAQPPRPGRPGPFRVLLIEDNPGDARLIELMLQEAGDGLFVLDHTPRLGDGLQRLATSPPAVVLLDLSLPDSEGLGTFSRLHTHSPRVPVIVLSGLNDTTLAVQAVHEGAQDFLVKGQVDGNSLVRAMRYAMERQRLTEQLGRYAEELRSKNAQLEADFNMAREIQQIFLPQQYPVFPYGVPLESSVLKFSHRYEPAAAVGGDFFDIFPLSATAVGVIICDVMGHGMRAALITAIMRGLVEELLPIAGDPGRFLSGINRSLRAILRRTREPFLATAFYLTADMATAEARFANAGHPSPLRIRRRTREVQFLKSIDARHGPALGLFEKATYPTGACPMEAGDLFLLFTDGLYEVRNATQEEYGLERVAAAAAGNLPLSTPELLNELVRNAELFSESAEFEDDVCLVAVEMDG